VPAQHVHQNNAIRHHRSRGLCHLHLILNLLRPLRRHITANLRNLLLSGCHSIWRFSALTSAGSAMSARQRRVEKELGAVFRISIDPLWIHNIRMRLGNTDAHEHLENCLRWTLKTFKTNPSIDVLKKLVHGLLVFASWRHPANVRQ